MREARRRRREEEGSQTTDYTFEIKLTKAGVPVAANTGSATAAAEKEAESEEQSSDEGEQEEEEGIEMYVAALEPSCHYHEITHVNSAVPGARRKGETAEEKKKRKEMAKEARRVRLL